MMTILSNAFALFLLMDAFGNIPIYLSVLKDIPQKRQLIIIIREMIISLVIILLFALFGNAFLNFLHISEKSMQLSGGIVLFILGMRMIFPPVREENFDTNTEPFIFPLAVPLVAGPAVLASVIIFSHQQISSFCLICSVFVAWFATATILLIAGSLSHKIDKRGLSALERLMGLILIMIAIDMFLEGLGKVTTISVL